ncbi:MAG: PHP domain-containing protein [Oscillospiraceae bacterium]|nr:PHP domain-containing protein [Oscillospiraceae bacterium]
MKYLYETHMHTSRVSLCSDCSPVRQVRAYKDRGYAGIIITDHFINGNSACPPEIPWDKKMKFIASGYEEAKKEGDRCGLDVFFGWEFTIDGMDFLTYGLSLDFLIQHPDIDTLTVEKYSALVRSCGGFLAQAHPYRVARWIKNPYPANPQLIDAAEVYNASMPAETNKKALHFAELHNLPALAGSDSHYKSIPFASGIALSKKAGSIFDIINAVKTREAKLILP